MTKSLTITHQTGLKEQHVSQNKNNIVSDMGGEKVILSIENGKYYNLGIMGSQIWDLVAEPLTFSSIVDSLLNEFDVTREVCEEQVLSFLTHLLEEQLLEVSE